MDQERNSQSESLEFKIQTFPVNQYTYDDNQAPQPHYSLPRKTSQTISFQNLHHQQSNDSDCCQKSPILLTNSENNPYQLASLTTQIQESSMFKNFIDLQQEIVDLYPVFPQITLNQLQTNINPILLSKTIGQLIFLFNCVQEHNINTCHRHQQVHQQNQQPFTPTSIDPHKQAITPRDDFQQNPALYRTLHKQDDLIRSLRSENEYLSQQVNVLKKETNMRLRVEMPSLSPKQYTSVMSRSNDRSRSQPVSKAPLTPCTPWPTSLQNQTILTDIVLSATSQRLIQNVVDDQDLAVVKFDLQQLQEVVRLKAETCKNLQKQIESQKRRFILDLETSSKKFEKKIIFSKCRIEELSMDVAQKDMMITELKNQLDAMVNQRAINVNYIVTKPQKVIPELNTTPKKQKNGNTLLQSIFRIENELESIMLDSSRQAVCPIKPTKNQKGKPIQKQQTADSGDQKQSLQRMIFNQIAAVQIADELISEAANQSKNNKPKTISDFEEQVKKSSDANIKLAQELKSMKQEKLLIQERLQMIRQDNNDIKFKFAQLLENFQDYVSDQELKSKLYRPSKQSQDFQNYLSQKPDVNQMIQEIEEDSEIATTMRRKIQDLERIIKGLQNELLLKEDIFNVLKRENQTLVEILANRPQEKPELNISAGKFNLEAELDNARFTAEVRLNHQRQYYEDKIDNILRNVKPDDDVQQQQQLQQKQQQYEQDMTIGSVNLANGIQHMRLEAVGQSQKNLPQKGQQLYNSSSQCLTYGCARQQQEVDQLKTQLLQSEHLVSEKNREIIKLKMVHDDITQRLRTMSPSVGGLAKKRQQEQPINNNRRQLIAELEYFVNTFRQSLRQVRKSTAQLTGSQLFKDLQVGDNDQKLASFDQCKDIIYSEEAFTVDFKIQMQELTALSSLLSEIKLLANTPQTNQLPSKDAYESTYRAKRNADEMLRQNHCSAMHKLLCEKIQQSEVLLQENTQLQRTVKLYEVSLSELDSVQKKSLNETELKRIIRTQANQIVQLKRYIQKLNVNQKENVVPFSESASNYLEQQVEDLKTGNDELLDERQKQLNLINGLQNQAQISVNHLEQVMTQLKEKTDILEANEQLIQTIHAKLTKIAEIFERKQIEQKYSIDVLTDFIFEKACRMKNKYESATQQVQAMEQEKVYYYQRKVESLDHEVQDLKQVQQFYQKVNKLLIPKFYDLLDQSVPKQNCEEQYSFKILEKSELQMRSMAKNLQTYQERFTELQGKFDHLADEVIGNPSLNSSSFNNQDIDCKLKTALQEENQEIKQNKKNIINRIFDPLRSQLLRDSVSGESNSKLQ